MKFFESRDIFTPGENTPAHVHSSCVTQTPSGNLIAVWYENGPWIEGDYRFSRNRDKSDDVRIAGAFFDRIKGEWSAPCVFADTYAISDNNPVVSVAPDGALWLVYSVMPFCPASTWSGTFLMRKRSLDYDRPGTPVWCDADPVIIKEPDNFDQACLKNGIPAEMSDVIYRRRLGWMPRNHMFPLPDGGMLLPLANENVSIPAMLHIRPDGRSWTMTSCLDAFRCIQPSIVRLSDGRLRAYLRHEPDTLFCDSDDCFATSTPAASSGLPNPGSAVEAVTLDDGLLVLAHNASPENRSSLAVSFSRDDGKTFRTKLVDSGEGARYDYPSLIQAQSGLIEMTYSCNLKTVRHVAFNEEWLLSD